MKISCNFCKSENLNLILDLGSSPLANSLILKKNKKKVEFTDPLRLFCCQKCHLFQVPHNISPDIFFKNYDYLSGISKTWVRHCKNYASHVEQKFQLKKTNGEILEVASNDGTLLNFFQKKKYRCLGIEPSLQAAKIAKKNKIQTICNYLNPKLSNKLNKKKFILIIANNVIAHVLNIGDFVKSISKLCSDETIVSIEFPHLENLFKKKQFDTIYHEHHYYHSIYSLNNILIKNNLQIFDYEKIKIHGGSIRVYAKKTKNKKNEIKKILKVINIEKKQIKKIIKNKDKFQYQINSIKKKIIKLIKKIKQSNLTIHAYGAAAKGNTFLNFCGINNTDIPYVYDNNKLKSRKLLPGSKIEILESKFIKEKKPNILLILVWNIKKEVMKQLKFTKKWNCKFLTAIPSIKYN
jgi:hypothetical protein